MAKERGWWNLDLHEQRMEDLSDADREHIAKCIVGGNTGGEIVKEDDWKEDVEGIYPDYDEIELGYKIKPR